MKTLVVSALAVVLLTGAAATARQSDPDLTRFTEQYQAAWNKGDAKALAALYSQNAMRAQPNAAPLVGRAAIEQFFVKSFAGDWKGTKLTVKQGRSQEATPEIRIQEGTWEVSGGAGGPQRGRYLNTVMREGGEWRLLSVSTVPDTPPAK
jgi:uncharacterized protein (TIGR02246 family)